MKKLILTFITANLLLLPLITSGRSSHIVLIKLETQFGVAIAELYPQKAPITVKNFLSYITSGAYRNATFHRTVHSGNQPNDDIKIDVIQAGIQGPSMPAISHETTIMTGVLHENGTLSMARRQPGTATASFFICIGDQRELDFGGLRNPDGQGFAAFGKIISGMKVIKKIQQSNAVGQSLTPEILINNISVL